MMKAELNLKAYQKRGKRSLYSPSRHDRDTQGLYISSRHNQVNHSQHRQIFHQSRNRMVRRVIQAVDCDDHKCRNGERRRSPVWKFRKNGIWSSIMMKCRWMAVRLAHENGMVSIPRGVKASRPFELQLLLLRSSVPLSSS